MYKEKEKTKMEEQKNINNQQPRGWADVVITPDMPLNAIIHFANILNQRLCALEDVTTLPNGKTLTKLYQEEAAAEQTA